MQLYFELYNYILYILNCLLPRPKCWYMVCVWASFLYVLFIYVSIFVSVQLVSEYLYGTKSIGCSEIHKFVYLFGKQFISYWINIKSVLYQRHIQEKKTPLVMCFWVNIKSEKYRTSSEKRIHYVPFKKDNLLLALREENKGEAPQALLKFSTVKFVTEHVMHFACFPCSRTNVHVLGSVVV